MLSSPKNTGELPHSAARVGEDPRNVRQEGEIHQRERGMAKAEGLEGGGGGVGSSRDEGVEGVHKGWTGIRKSEMKEVFVHELECRVDTSEIQSSGRRSEEVVAHESLLRCKVA